MKRLVAIVLVGFTTLGMVGCAPEADETAAIESELVTQTRLDRVTPGEVAAVYAAALQPDIARCIAGNPNIVAVDRSNLDAFYRPGVQSYWGVRSALEGMLSEPGVTSIPAATVATEIEPWAKRVMSAHVDGAGYYAPPRDTGLTFYTAETTAREAKALSLAAAPGGKTLKDVRAEWAEVQHVQNNLDSAWLNPVKVSGNPGLGDIRKAMNIPYQARYTEWGHDAVDAFHEAGEGPDEVAEFDPLATFLKSSAIKKRWLFQGGGDEWSTNVLVVLDEHDQLWGMQMGYSE